MTGKGTVMTRWTGSSAGLPVSGSLASTSNWLRPAAEVDLGAPRAVRTAVARYGWSRPEAVIAIVAPAIDVPAKV